MEELRPLESEVDGAAIVGLWEKVWEESKKMWKVTGPAILARTSAYGIFIVTQAFIGHIGSNELAAYALLQILGLQLVTGILVGMSSATETLCGQAFGLKQYKMLGIYLQRSWIVNLVTATALVPIFLLTKPILKLLGEDDDIAEAAGDIAPWFIPIIYYFVFSLTIQQFLQSQSKNQIVGLLFAASFMIHLLLSWLFIHVLDWGIPGAMCSMIASTWSVVIAEFVYVFGGWCPDTWMGFTSGAFSDLLPFVKLSVSSGLMLCLEIWYTAILVLLASHMKNASVAISAFSICLNIANWEFKILIGFMIGASVRVSNELGRGNAKATRFAVQVNLGTSTVFGVFFGIICLVLGSKIASPFTSDKGVAEEVSKLAVLLAFTIFLNSFQPALSGVAIGSGMQGIVAWMNIVFYYVVGVPLGVVLAFVAHLAVRGIWIGMLVGIATQAAWLGFVIWRADWEDQVEKAAERLNRFNQSQLEDIPDCYPQRRLDHSREELSSFVNN